MWAVVSQPAVWEVTLAVILMAVKSSCLIALKIEIQLEKSMLIPEIWMDFSDIRWKDNIDNYSVDLQL